MLGIQTVRCCNHKICTGRVLVWAKMKQRFFLDALGDRLLETATKGTPGDKSGGGTGFDSITSRWTGLRRMNSTSGSLRRARQTATDRLTPSGRFWQITTFGRSIPEELSQFA